MQRKIGKKSSPQSAKMTILRLQYISMSCTQQNDTIQYNAIRQCYAQYMHKVVIIIFVLSFVTYCSSLAV